VSCAERSHNWQKLVHSVKTVDRNSEHLHKFAALLGKISLEEQFQIRVEFEESCVEELGRGLGDRGDLPEAILHEFDLFIRHADVLLIQ
jgi:hypothetical protein